MNNQPPDNSPQYPPQQSSRQYPPQQYPPQQPSGQYPPQQYPPQQYPQQQPSGQYPPQQYPPQQYPPQPSGQYPPQQFSQQQPGQYPPQQYPPQRYDGPPQGFPQGPQGFPQTPQPPKKRGRGPLIAIGVIVAVLLVACIAAGVAAASYIGKTATTPTTTTKTGTTNSGVTPTAGSTQSKNHKIGDLVQVGTDWTVMVNSVKTSAGSSYTTPKAGMKYLVIDLSMKNLSAEAQAVSSIVQFTLRGDDGTKYDVTIYPDAGSIIDGKVDAGQPAKGVIVYEVPTNINTFHLTFANNPYDTTAPDATWDLSV